MSHFQGSFDAYAREAATQLSTGGGRAAKTTKGSRLKYGTGLIKIAQACLRGCGEKGKGSSDPASYGGVNANGPDMINRCGRP
jgi:hypothetical protein